jgi:hypothetical protein
MSTTKVALCAEAPAWAQLLAEAIDAYPPKRFTGKAQFNMWRDPRLAYCLHGTARPDGARCVVSRSYKPLGTADDGTWVNYETATGCHVTAEHFARLVADDVINNRGGWLNPSGGYLFHDEDAPWLGRAEWERYMQVVRALLAPWAARKEAS